MNAISVNAAFEAMDDVDSRSFEPMPRGKQRRPEPRRKGNGGSGGGFQCRRNKHHTWGTGAGARLADLRAFAGAIALLLVAVVSPASADSFGVSVTAAPVGPSSPITGLGQLTDDFMAVTKVTEAFSVDLGRNLAGIPTAAPTAWLADVSSRPSLVGTLSATQLAADAAAPSQWPVASDVIVEDRSSVLATIQTSDAPEQFGDYVNTYSTYGQWETIGELAPSAGASGDLLAVGNVPTVGEEFLLSSLDRSEGLRVAVVAVPEPSNAVAGAISVGGLIAVALVRRRHAKLQPARVVAC